MAKYRIEFKPLVWKDLDGIPKADRRKILKRIERLSEDPCPMGSKKLAGSERYRARQGVYRILYSIEEARLVVVVVKVAHRREIYER
ncbi:MAG: type II toxin-antitoxin system RelE/ParE family toxin [Acidobacteria bacterium]|nr:type II toxin-antitoxin system RelE/ParE family toxin [Acidobacteriota bacterium]MCA1608802.1 type II toxin-antitoxin system RelE/ParE family toxin [Acidobacteriota bacterium]